MNITECQNCELPIQKNDTDGLCFDCKNDPSVTISFTEAKTKYKLTDTEINQSELYTINVSYLKQIQGRRFLVREVEELADKIYSHLPDNDARKRRYKSKNDRIRRKAQIDAYIHIYLDEDFIRYNQDLYQMALASVNIPVKEILSQLQDKYDELADQRERRKKLVQNLDKIFEKVFTAKKIKEFIDPDIPIYRYSSVKVRNLLVQYIKNSEIYQSYVNNTSDQDDMDIERSNIIEKFKQVANEYFDAFIH